VTYFLHFEIPPSITFQRIKVETSTVHFNQNGGYIEHTFHCLQAYCIIIVVTDFVLKYFLEYDTTFSANYQPG